MPPTDAEFEELRSRVERLERQVEELTRPVSPPVLPPVLKPAAAQPPPPPKLSPKPSRTISSTAWVAGVGAVIFLIGAIYGLTVAIQRGWLSPPVRVGLGLAVGVFLGVLAAKRLSAGLRGSGVALLAAGAGTWTFAFYYGAQQAELFPLWAGYIGTSVAIFFAGFVAAGTRCDGALAVALVTGLIAPLAFSTGEGKLALLMVHLLVLGAAQLVVHYRARSGGDWIWSRMLGTAGVWFLAWWGSMEGSLELGVSWLIELYCVLGIAGLLLAWLPRHPEQPRIPAVLTAVVLVAFAVCAWEIWDQSGVSHKPFALVLTGVAGVVFGLIAPARRRTGSVQHDVMLLVLGTGFVLVAVPVAFDWRWVAIGWSLFALSLSVAARSAHAYSKSESDGLILAASIAATCASAWIVNKAQVQGPAAWPVLNVIFISGILVSAAWGVLTLIPGNHRRVTFPMMQLIFVPLIAWELRRVVPTMRSENMVLAWGAILATLIYAIAGAGQWLRGVIDETNGFMAKAMRRMGYAWLAIATFKLLFKDLARTDMLFRAVVALGVGSILLGAAFWADKRRKRTQLPPEQA